MEPEKRPTALPIIAAASRRRRSSSIVVALQLQGQRAAPMAIDRRAFCPAECCDSEESSSSSSVPPRVMSSFFGSPDLSASLSSTSTLLPMLPGNVSNVHPPSAYSRWSYEPMSSVAVLPDIEVPRCRANSYTSGVRKKDKRKPRGAASVDRNNNDKENSRRQRKRFLGSSEQAEKERLNEGIVKESAAVVKVTGRQDIAYTIGRKIGDGNFASVSAAVHRKDGTEWAIKEVDKRKMKGRVYYMENEVELMLNCAHANICRLREAYQSPTAYFLVIELIDNGDLFDAIKENGTLTERVTAVVVGDVCSALAYLHQRDIVHRDIKPENLLLTVHLRAKLADFGLACRVLGPLFRVCGTPTYVAPEILVEKGYGVPVDVWSMGVITHVMLVGYAPFRSQNRSELFRLIRKGDFSFELPGWARKSDGAKDAVRRMLTVNVGKRITAQQLLRLRWICKYRKEVEE